ncbi:Clavaminate synthase-like protein [Sistotremastrum suecicum HHB10207 ss-3]|uniref:Clavaminate synthase-like protein n=1 Tax=Sistotremastrum suecicum HHB10207 ss-3 TaxID=1314776 RepID=A0A165ZJV0_9AGAM|nr:Clavaminate synthase-like protein [Sistotremastrum suecicum HHB10207 ss-3]
MSPPSLPIISIAPYLPTSTASEKQKLETSRALHEACRDYGFFYLDISSFADKSETDELTDLAREFFALPQDVKDRLSLRNQDNARGYARLNENVTQGKADAHEGLDFYRPVPNPDKNIPLHGENQWPDVSHFRERYQRWTERMQELGLLVMEAMSVGLGMTREEWKQLRSQVDHSFWVMRVIGYPPLPTGHDGFSCGAHRDYGCLTFLYADPTKSALQVFLQNPSLLSKANGHTNGHTNGANGTSQPILPTEEGSEKGVWIYADPIPGCVVCNIGEMWEIWTNGLYKSTLHRVLHKGSNYRIPFFFEPNFDALVEPLAAISRLPEADSLEIDKARKPVVYGDFLLQKVGSNFSEGGGKYS